MEHKKTIISAGAVAVAAAAGAVGVAVARRKAAEPQSWSVRPADDGWLVARDGHSENGSRHATKKDAISAGRRIAASRAPSTLVLHYADGRVQKRLTYEAE